MRASATRNIAILGAAVGWCALALQLVLTIGNIQAQGGTLLDGVWRYLGYFTVIANLFAAAALTLAALCGSALREYCAVTAMILVGITYSVLLRSTWNPQGWQKLADIALHDVMPVIVLLFWLLRPHRRLRWNDVAVAMILPLGYIAYAMTRGANEGWYPYAFMDVGQFGASQVAFNCLWMGAGFAALAALLVRLDRRLS